MEEFDQEQSGEEQLDEVEEEAADLETGAEELGGDEEESAFEGESEAADDI